MSTSTSPCPSSPTHCAQRYAVASPATRPPPPTPCNDASSKPAGASSTATITSSSSLTGAPTHPSSAPPTSPNTHPSPGGATDPSASTSPRVELAAWKSALTTFAGVREPRTGPSHGPAHRPADSTAASRWTRPAPRHRVPSRHVASRRPVTADDEQADRLVKLVVIVLFLKVAGFLVLVGLAALRPTSGRGLVVAVALAAAMAAVALGLLRARRWAWPLALAVLMADAVLVNSILRLLIDVGLALVLFLP